MAGKEEAYYCIYLMLIFASIDAVEGICARECRPYPNPQKELQMKCRRNNEQMFYLDVRCSKTANGQCSGSIECSGLQQEVLRQVAEECYWQRRCNIVMNNTYVNIFNLDGQCINIIPDVFESRALCVRTNKLLDFYSVNSPVRLKDGVMRISSTFPWHYSTSPPLRSISFKARSGKKLRVTFLEADLDTTTDQLTIRSGQTVVNVTRGQRNQYLDFGAGDVVLEFSVGSSSRRGKGFVFCFHWLAATSGSTKHACDLVGGVKCLPGKLPKKGRRNRNGNRNRNRGRNRNRNRRTTTPSTNS